MIQVLTTRVTCMFGIRFPPSLISCKARRYGQGFIALPHYSSPSFVSTFVSTSMTIDTKCSDFEASVESEDLYTILGVNKGASIEESKYLRINTSALSMSQTLITRV